MIRVDELCRRGACATVNEQSSTSREDTTVRSSTIGDQALREIDTLREQLQAVQQELVWSNRLTTLGTMSAVLAHEYNNLLTPIGSYAQLALANPDDAELTRKALQAAAQGVARAQGLAEATLGFARPDDADRPDTCTVQEALDHALTCLEGAIKHVGVTLTTDLTGDHVAIRLLSLQQVLINLIDNACKAMADQKPPRRLTIQAKRIGHGLEIEVRDNGPGIPDAVRGQLFDAFVTEPAGANQKSGTGLGLRVCKDLINSAGGSIRVDSSAGQGTRFRITLPIIDHNR